MLWYDVIVMFTLQRYWVELHLQPFPSVRPFFGCFPCTNLVVHEASHPSRIPWNRMSKKWHLMQRHPCLWTFLIPYVWRFGTRLCWDPTVWSMGLAGRGLEGIPCCGFARQLPGLVKENWQRYLARLMAVFFFPVISILFENTFCCEIFVQ